MGCWNETDALTKLPIESGEKAVLFVLTYDFGQGTKPTGIFNTTKYIPVGLPFYGTYNDYGLLHLDPSYADYHSRFLDTLRGDKPASIEEFFSTIKDRTSHTGTPYVTMMVKQGIWEAMLQEFGSLTPYVPAGQVARTYREQYEEVFDDYEKIVAAHAALTDEEKQDPRKSVAVHTHLYRLGHSIFASSFWDSITLSMENGMTPELRENAIRLLLTDRLLEDIRRGWSPQFGAGSQEENYELHVKLAQLALDEADAALKSWNESYGLDE